MIKLKTVVFAFGFMASVNCYAQAVQPLVGEIVKLSNDISNVALSGNASVNSLQAAKIKLQEALHILSQSTTPTIPVNKECFKFAYDHYFQTYSSASATDKAIQLCKKTSDMEVLTFLYDKYFMTLSSAQALDKAGELSTYQNNGKTDMISFAYDKYFMTLSSTMAVTKAATNTQKVPVGSVSCLSELYDKYFQTFSSAQAMDKAFEACSQK